MVETTLRKDEHCVGPPGVIPCIDSHDATLSNVSIFGTVLSQKIPLLVDTGAAICVVSEKFYNEILRSSFLLQKNDSVDNIKTADGNITPVVGLVSFKVTIGDQLYNCNASVVPNLAYSIVLGRDFLHAYSAVIDVKGQTVTFDKQNTIAFVGNYNRPTIYSDVRTAKTYVIEGHCEAIIPAYLEKPLDPVVGLIETNQNLADNYHLIAAVTLTMPDDEHRVTFRLINPNDAPVLLHKGTSIGTFCALSTDDDIIEFRPDPVISSMEKSVKDVRSFLGLCNYYRRFVKDFAKIASPLNRLTRKSVPFVWDPSCEKAFADLKTHLCSPPILAYPDFAQPFHLYIDASQHAIGYILGQVIDGYEQVIAYGGRELNLAETRYSTTEREALAVVDGIKRYQPYLYGGKFFVHSDHGSLSWLMKVKDPTGRLARWALQLQQYDFDIIHRPGVQNGAADALSRRPYETSNVLPISALSLPTAAIDHPCPPPVTLYTLQRQDSNLHDIIAYLENADLPANDSKARSLLLSIHSYYLDEHGVLCHLWSPETSPDLLDADLPPDSFEAPGTDSLQTVPDNLSHGATNANDRISHEPAILRPEDTYTPAQILPV
eukprot:gene16269-17909_t